MIHGLTVLHVLSTKFENSVHHSNCKQLLFYFLQL